MLNTLWGRLAMQDNKPKFEYVRNTERFNRILYSNLYDIRYVNIQDENTVQVQSTFRNPVHGQDSRWTQLLRHLLLATRGSNYFEAWNLLDQSGYCM